MVKKKIRGLQSGDTLQDRRGQKFIMTQECWDSGALSKTMAVMMCQSKWFSQKPGQMKSLVHGRR